MAIFIERHKLSTRSRYFGFHQRQVSEACPYPRVDVPRVIIGDLETNIPRETFIQTLKMSNNDSKRNISAAAQVFSIYSMMESFYVVNHQYINKWMRLRGPNHTRTLRDVHEKFSSDLRI